MRSCSEGLTIFDDEGCLNCSRWSKVWKVKGSGWSSVGVRGPELDDDDAEEDPDERAGGEEDMAGG